MPRAETSGWRIPPRSEGIKRQALQRISVALGLVVLSLGFPIFGVLIMVNQRQADLNDLSGHSPFVPLGGLGAILLGTAFLTGAYLHWRSHAPKKKQEPTKDAYEK